MIKTFYYTNMEQIDYAKTKLYKVHVDVTLNVQKMYKTIPLSLSIFADNEQEAKAIVENLKISNIKVDKCKTEVDFSEYIKHDTMLKMNDI